MTKKLAFDTLQHATMLQDGGVDNAKERTRNDDD